jgi:rsbT antagonist protein RsbS
LSAEGGGIIRVGPTLLVRLHGDLEDETVLRLEHQITSEASRVDTTGVLVDVTDLILVDSFIARVIARLVAMVRLLGSDVVLVGVQPAVAITLVEMGVRMSGIATALNAERGMAKLRRRQL